MTSHYEYSSDFLNIVIYGIKKEVLFPINYDLPKSMKIDQMIPDILQKMQNTPLSKKAIVVNDTEKELLQIK